MLPLPTAFAGLSPPGSLSSEPPKRGLSEKTALAEVGHGLENRASWYRFRRRNGPPVFALGEEFEAFSQ